jgi:hypothetical protein
MTTHPRSDSASTWLTAALAAAAGSYLAYAAATWLRFGRAPQHARPEDDGLLNKFMPTFDIVERHHIRVAAPADVTLAAAGEMDLFQSCAARAIFRGRELILGSDPDTTVRPRGLLALTQSLGWGVLATARDRQIVMGAVTRPWEANVVFRALPPTEFAAFDDPDFVKIAWTLRADAIDAAHSIFHTETRAVATDALARAKFRRYWAFLSPGIILVRWLTLKPLQREAERRAHGVRSQGS